MGVTVQRLRRWVAVTACLLVAVVAGFVIYGRGRLRRIEKDLPGRLGANIQQTATGWSYSQSSQGHTLFTIKASKESQLKSGHVLLHDVDITLFGPPGSGRQDRIWGSDFDYDENNGVAISKGDVNIELSGVNGASGSSGSSGTSGTTGATTPQSSAIRLRTSGLTFAQKTGDASTEQPLEFHLPRAAGSAVGGSYNSKDGLLVLNSDVKITTSSNGRSSVVRAAHATMLRSSMQAYLKRAALAYENGDGSAEEATVFFRKDGTVEKIDARENVRMRTDAGATLSSQAAEILMNQKGQPLRAALDGGITFSSVQPNERMNGSARSGTLQFAESANGQTAPRHAEFLQDVHFTQEIAGLPKDPRGRAVKKVDGQKVDVDFAPPREQGEIEARKVYADGSPVITMEQMPSKGPEQSTRISGDQLVASLGAGNVLQALDGSGHTSLIETATDGSVDTSKGDTLHTTFRQQPSAKPVGAAAQTRDGKEAHETKDEGAARDENAGTATTLDTAIQDGNVAISETPAKKVSAPASTEKTNAGGTNRLATMKAWAEHAEYHEADEVLHLSGNPRISDEQTMQMTAERIDYRRRTKEATAEGDVKATYTQQANAPTGTAGFSRGNGPVHVIAQRASMQNATRRADFFGTMHEPARMWQSADLLTAPTIEIDRGRNMLKAWGEDSGAQPVVNATFTSAMGSGGHQPSATRVHSQTLVYSDQARKAGFHGAVTLEQADGVIHADDGLVYLKPAQPGGNLGEKTGLEKQNSQIDHIVAEGHVVFTQPGRKGDGTRLVYTADTGHYVLTGTPEAPPRIWDSEHGTTTGVSLLFNSQDDSVEVSGGKSSAVTQTRAPR